MDGTQGPCPLPQPRGVTVETGLLPWRLCPALGPESCCEEQMSVDRGKEEPQRGSVWGFLRHRPTFLDHPRTCPVSPSSLRHPDTSNTLKETVFLPGEHGPLHHDCNTIFPLWGCECYSAKPCLKTSFIIHRLQTEIVFDNLCRKQEAFWLLASRLKGRKHMFTVRRSPWRKH